MPVSSPTAPDRPMLRYFGGKWQLADWIIGFFPRHRIYVEPFAGAGSVFFKKAPSAIEVVNDVDAKVVNVYRVLRDPDTAAELERLIRLTPWSRDEYERAHEPTNDIVEWARRTIVLSFQAHGSAGLRKGRYSGWRSQDSSANGHAAHAWMTWPDAIRQFHKRLMGEGVVVERSNALDVIRVHDKPDTLFYVDPPYVKSERTSHHGYDHDFTNDDHCELARTLKACKGAVILSGYPSPLYRKLFRTWERVSCDVTLAWGSSLSGSKSVERTECLWLNRRAASARPSLFASIDRMRGKRAG